MTEAVTPKKSEVEAKKPRRHITSPSDKIKIVTLWKQGEMTIVDLAKKFKRDRATIKSIITAAGAVKGSDAKKVEERVKAEVERHIVDDAVVIADRIRATKDEHYKAATGIAKIAWNLVVQTQQSGNRMGSIINDLKSLKIAADTLSITRKERYVVLGVVEGVVDDGTELPSLEVRELTVDDIKEMNRQAAVQAADELGIPDLEMDVAELDSEGGDGDLNPRVETE